ncbi:MAG: hypothetical protein JF597_49050 [Streptomyces sp.]|uniref:hypothetical protein n=1 Tax=Streptomyces sp. TaxID=1931 RepID=UPI0025D61A49|nr:hypothetical protein [Streptomyces sp.]MBW8801220.1 hypothetical protein [Streptomyces sp.]
MLTSINPLGQRARSQRWTVTVLLYTVASVVGGMTTGLVLGALGEVLPVPTWAVAVLVLLAALLDLVGRVPTGRRQVDEDWLTRYRAWVYATGFGWQLGTGVVTIVTSAATYAWLAVLVLLGLPAAVVVGGAFGLVRALPLLAGRTADTPERLRDLARRLDSGRGWAQRLTPAALVVGGLGLLA